MILRLKVSLKFGPAHVIPVGGMLRASSGSIYFQFDAAALDGSFQISPFKLRSLPEPQTPLATEVDLFDGLFGVFADSLPDGWGLMMMSRAMKNAGFDFNSTSALDRLAFIGGRAMGALIFEPETSSSKESGEALRLAELAAEAQAVLAGKTGDVLGELLLLGGSPGGARPKVMVGVEHGADGFGDGLVAGIDDLPVGYEHWLVKFHGAGESREAGIVEYIYSETARQVGLVMEPCRLFGPMREGPWFGTRRFDRGPANTRVHMHTAAGLLHANFRLPSLDYRDLLKVTMALTKQKEDLLQMFRLAAFNVVFHNRDDHAKNFTFVMSQSGEWRLAPAYDLTYSPGPGGEHTTAVMGEGRSPSRELLVKLGVAVGLEKPVCESIVQEVEAGRAYMKDAFRQYGLKSHPVLKHLGQK